MVPLEQVLGGDIAGPGGPHDKGQIVINTRGALISDHITVAAIDELDVELPTAILIEGRINRTPHRAKVVVIVNNDGVAGFISELVGFISRAKGPAATVALDVLIERLIANRNEGVDRQPEAPDGD